MQSLVRVVKVTFSSVVVIGRSVGEVRTVLSGRGVRTILDMALHSLGNS